MDLVVKFRQVGSPVVEPRFIQHQQSSDVSTSLFSGLFENSEWSWTAGALDKHGHSLAPTGRAGSLVVLEKPTTAEEL